MEKPRQTSCIPDTARATRLPVTTVAAERGRNSHRSPLTQPYSWLPHADPLWETAPEPQRGLLPAWIP